jgi:uncharacterized protein YbjT (DUF2867 family)
VTQDPTPELRVILFGATGMVGEGVLRACLADPQVTTILSISRRPGGLQDPKLQEILHQDFYDYRSLEGRLSGYNACLFTLGVSSVGMQEADYRRVTYDLTLAAAEAVLKANPGMSFAYITGAGTDSSEQGSSMWARVKGATENKLLGMGFLHATMFRPGGIQPWPGVRPKSPWVRALYALLDPFFPFLIQRFPQALTSSERLGRAMLKAVRGQAGLRVVESADINRLGA